MTAGMTQHCVGVTLNIANTMTGILEIIPRSLSENVLLPKLFVIFKKQCSQVSEDSDINYMAVLVF
jgi:hypothetical protein